MFPHRDGEESGVRKGENLSRLEGVLFLYNNKKKKNEAFHMLHIYVYDEVVKIFAFYYRV